MRDAIRLTSEKLSEREPHIVDSASTTTSARAFNDLGQATPGLSRATIFSNISELAFGFKNGMREATTAVVE